MIARPRNAERDVWQYAQGDGPPPAWVLGCTQARSDGLYLVRRSGKQRMSSNDWIIRDLDGDPTWMDNRDFQAAYEIVKP